MTNRINPEQTPDMSGPTDEEVEAVARKLHVAMTPDTIKHGYTFETDFAYQAYCKKLAFVAIRALDEVRRK